MTDEQKKQALKIFSESTEYFLDFCDSQIKLGRFDFKLFNGKYSEDKAIGALTALKKIAGNSSFENEKDDELYDGYDWLNYCLTENIECCEKMIEKQNYNFESFKESGIYNKDKAEGFLLALKYAKEMLDNFESEIRQNELM